MKIVINTNRKIEETEIIVNCNRVDKQIERLIALLSMDEKINGVIDGETYLIPLQEILYFESVDKKTFMYTIDKVYETSFRLYEIEDKYRKTDFFRGSKSTIINLRKVQSLKPILGGKIKVLLENKEILYVSRAYVNELKKKINF